MHVLLLIVIFNIGINILSIYNNWPWHLSLKDGSVIYYKRKKTFQIDINSYSKSQQQSNATPDDDQWNGQKRLG